MVEPAAKSGVYASLHVNNDPHIESDSDGYTDERSRDAYDFLRPIGLSPEAAPHNREQQAMKIMSVSERGGQHDLGSITRTHDRMGRGIDRSMQTLGRSCGSDFVSSAWSNVGYPDSVH